MAGGLDETPAAAGEAGLVRYWVQQTVRERVDGFEA